ncbi:MAG: hypothetical protein KDA78_16125, partial [Planctomycetaceae bacterium]|nr:hypothetical protein [Planctomycetaceae bacterium]
NTGSSGLLLLNPECRNCLAAVELPEGFSPKLEGCVKADQHDADKSFALVDIPAHGFCVVPGSSAPTTRRKKLAVPLAGDFFLQTEHFHVQIDVETGGIQRMRAQGSNENLYSMRLIYRLDGETGTISRSVRQYGERSTEPTYSKMVAESIQTLRTGPVVGEIQVSGKLVTPEDESLIARFEIGYRVTRGSHVVETTLRIMPEKLPSAQSDRSYYAVRSAWAASGATVKGTLQQSQFVAGEGLIESTGPIQILDGEQTISLFSEQRPFHRRTGMRMLDSLLIVHGESNREFRQAIGLNAPQLLATEQLLAHPPSPLNLPHVSGERSVWLYHFNSPSVMLLESTPVDNIPNCYDFDLNETEGRHCHVRWTLFRKPALAWEVDFRGNTLQELSIEQETILFEVMPCDYVRIRVQF